MQIFNRMFEDSGFSRRNRHCRNASVSDIHLASSHLQFRLFSRSLVFGEILDNGLSARLRKDRLFYLAGRYTEI